MNPTNAKKRLFLAVGLVGTLCLLSACWSARCPHKTCRVKVEHRHGAGYFRPNLPFSWMWTPRYKHIRADQPKKKKR